MTHPNASRRSSRTRKANTHRQEYTTVLIEPPKKPHSTIIWNKMFVTRKLETATKAVPVKYPPNKDKLGLEVIRIPCDGSTFELESIPLIGIGQDGIPSEECVIAKDWLKQFPNMRSVAHKSTFSWHTRHLIGIPANNLGSSVDESYFMYVCYEVKTSLPHNKYLENLSGVQIFGDGYLFKMRKDLDEDGKPMFLNMGPVSMTDLKNGGVTKEFVQKLLDSITQDVGKAKI